MDEFRNKINKIKNLEERRLLKDRLVQHEQDRYQQLEKRVLQEITMDQTKYGIYTAVCKITYNGFLFPIPMVEDDEKELSTRFGHYSTKNDVYEFDKIKNQIDWQEKAILFNIFIECEAKSSIGRQPK